MDSTPLTANVLTPGQPRTAQSGPEISYQGSSPRCASCASTIMARLVGAPAFPEYGTMRKRCSGPLKCSARTGFRPRDPSSSSGTAWVGLCTSFTNFAVASGRRCRSLTHYQYQAGKRRTSPCHCSLVWSERVLTHWSGPDNSLQPQGAVQAPGGCYLWNCEHLA